MPPIVNKAETPGMLIRVGLAGVRGVATM